MQKRPIPETISGTSLNTLAQSGTAQKQSVTIKRVKVVRGKGTDATQPSDLGNRAKRKMITQKVILKLIDIAKDKGELDRVKAYWNTYHCQSRVTKAHGRLYGNYCKNRFCTVCSGIRKAEIIHKYLPVVETWPEPYFVTLTSKAVPLKWLKGRIESTIRAFKRIFAKLKKRHQRGKGIKIQLVKSLECNYNPGARTYNPHLHLIVPDKTTADLIIAEWLNLWKAKHTSPYAQKAILIKNNESCLVEVVKYATKIFTDPTIQKKGKAKVDPIIYAKAYHHIIWALQGHRVFERFGFNLPKETARRESRHTTVTDFEELIFDATQFDWVNPATAEILTGFAPEWQLMAILDNNIDTRAQ